MKRSFLVLAAILVTGGPALAAGNPQSTGLTHTQSEARRTLATLVVRHEDSRCLRSAADSLTALPGLRRVAVREGALQATFASSGKAAQAESAMRASVAAACVGPSAPSASPAS